MNLKFRRQHQIGEYLVDLCCPSEKLVVEADGPAHGSQNARKHDHKRDSYLEALGFRIVRLSNERILNDTQAALEVIKRKLEELPSPGGRGAGGEGDADGSKVSNSRGDVLGRVYEYFLSEFASAEGNLGLEPADSFHRDLHKDLKADYILANPPFNMSDWGGERLREDPRWKFGVPSAGNANYAWVQHFIHHLAPTGVAGFVLANGSMSSNQSGEGEIRKAIIEADLVDCMVALPGQLFYSTQIPVCLWFLARDKKDSKRRKRSGQTLFLDARKLGRMIDRVHRDLTPEDITKIAGTYHAWRGDSEGRVPGAPNQRQGVAELRPPKYEDIPGFCKSAKLDEIRTHGYVLTPGRYVGAEAAEDDGEPFEQKMKRLTTALEEQFAESVKLEKAIRQNLKTLSHA